MDHDHGDGSSSGDNSTSTGAMMMMNMYFHLGLSETILFKFWKTTDIGGLLGSILFIFLLAVAYEALKFYRDYLYKNYYTSPKNMKKITNSSSPSSSSAEAGNSKEQFVEVRMFSSIHLWQTILHMVQTNLSYFLMFIFMTYNLWLCLAVGFGAGVGYFLFGFWRKSPTVDDTCHCY